MELTASAPGKVFVIGEYGVVSGGPAVVATVARRLRTRVRTRPGRGELLVRSRAGEVRCGLATERVDRLPADARFVAGAALVAMRALGLRDVDLEIETESELDPGASKTGLGGSAAVTAATVAALHGIAGRPADAADERDRVATAVYAHRMVQGGGSGADVIASTVGGLVWIDALDGDDVPDDVDACVARLRRPHATPTFERLTLPPEMTIDVVSSGRSCATGPRVARYAALVRRSADAAASPAVRAWAAGMRAASEIFRSGCQTGDASRVALAIRAACALLSRLGALAGIPVFTSELRRACAIAVDGAGAVAKPSGAGGGDCAIALLALERRELLRGLWRAAGLEPLEVELDPRGARCEVTT